MICSVFSLQINRVVYGPPSTPPPPLHSLPVFLSFCLSVCLSVYVSLSVFLSACLSLSLRFCLPEHGSLVDTDTTFTEIFHNHRNVRTITENANLISLLLKIRCRPLELRPLTGSMWQGAIGAFFMSAFSTVSEKRNLQNKERLRPPQHHSV